MAAGRAFLYTLRNGDTTPDLNSTWNEYGARLSRYAWYTSYYNNNVYDDLQARVLQLSRANRALYRFTRGLRNPVARLVDLCTAKCYGGSIDYQNLEQGAIPILQADDVLKEAIKQVFLWSNFGVEKSLFVRNAAMLGDTALKVVDEPNKGKVRLEVLHPSYIKDVQFDAVGNVKAYILEYEVSEETEFGSGQFRSYTYREKCDGDWFETFKDGKAFGFITDSNGDLVDRWPNVYGFAPLVIGHYKDLGLDWGVNAFHNAVPKIDDACDLASALNDYLRRAMNPRWAGIGVDEPKKDPTTGKSSVDTRVGKRDDEGIIYVPKPDAKFQSLVHPVDVSGALADIDALMKEIKEDLPELALADIRAAGNLTAPGVRAGYSEAIDRITESNGNLDDSLVRAVQMAISIGALRRYKNFTAFDMGSFDRGDLAFFIKEREVIEDKLSALERQQAWQQSGAPEQKLWSLLGATDEEIAEWSMQKQRDKMLALMAQQQQQIPSGLPNQQPAQLPSGQSVQGDPLPDAEAEADIPLTDADAARINAMFNALKGATGNA